MRLQRLQTIGEFIARTEAAFPGQNTIVVGWEPIIGELSPASPRHNHYVYSLSGAEAEELNRQGQGIAYTSEVIRSFNYRTQKIDLVSYGARNVRLLLTGAP